MLYTSQALSLIHPLHADHCYSPDRQLAQPPTQVQPTHMCTSTIVTIQPQTPLQAKLHLLQTPASNSSGKVVLSDHKKGESSHSSYMQDEKVSGKYFSLTTFHPRLITCTCNNIGQCVDRYTCTAVQIRQWSGWGRVIVSLSMFAHTLQHATKESLPAS